MELYLDNDPFTAEATTLGDIVEAGRLAAAQSGRIVVEVRVDGRALDGDELDAGAGREPEGLEVQLITAEPRTLAKVTLYEVRDVLAAAQDEQKQAAALLTTDDPTRAHESLRSALVAWDQAQQAVGQVAALLEVDLDAISVNDRSAVATINDLAAQLNTVRDQMESTDWIGLSDTLAYELTETATRWIAMVDQMIKQIEGEARSTQ